MKADMYIFVPKKLHIEILKFLLKDIEKKYTQLELAKAIGKETSYKGIRENIKTLVENKILLTETVGASIICFLNLQEPKALDYLAFIENSKKYDFLRRHHEIEEITERLIEQIKFHTVFFSLLLFGSYVKGTQHRKSDIDLLAIGDKEYHSGIKREWMKLRAIYEREINLITVTKDDYIEMLASKEEINVGKESLKNHIILYGTESFYQLVREAYGKR